MAIRSLFLPSQARRDVAHARLGIDLMTDCQICKMGSNHAQIQTARAMTVVSCRAIEAFEGILASYVMADHGRRASEQNSVCCVLLVGKGTCLLIFAHYT